VINKFRQGEKMETNNMINVSDDTSTAIAKDEMVKSTSHLISTESISYTAADFADYVVETLGTSWGTAFVTIIASIPAKKLEAALLSYIGIEYSAIIAVIGIVEAIKAAVDTAKLANVTRQLKDGNYTRVIVTANNYEWLSGSGNHTGYYSTVSYSLR
jgi:hypothetical protein